MPSLPAGESLTSIPEGQTMRREQCAERKYTLPGPGRVCAIHPVHVCDLQ